MKQRQRRQLVLAVEDVLCHPTRTALYGSPDLETSEGFVYFRPYLRGFLERVGARFELVFWSSDETLARRMAEAVMVGGRPYAVIGGTHCWVEPGATETEAAPTTTAGSRVVVLAEDATDEVAPDTHVLRVKPFGGDHADYELVFLAEFLERCGSELGRSPWDAVDWRTRLCWTQDRP